MKFNKSILGRDFYLYRFGQVISVIGDGCSGIALSWWILDATGSAAKLASVFVPYAAISIVLAPLMGPLGDRYERKLLIAWGDLLRGIITLILAIMVILKMFHLPTVIFLYSLIAVGNALFNAGSTGIIPKLVSNEHMSTALRQGEIIMSFGRIIGGIVGGVIVSLIGVSGAFIIDAISFFMAMYATLLIKTNTRSDLHQTDNSQQKINPFKAWFQDLILGFKVLIKIPLELWLALVLALINFVLSPIGIALPVLVKEARHMPAWFLGALEASISVGSIIGAFFIGKIVGKIKNDIMIFLGVIMLGIGILSMPLIPNISQPLMMFLFGFGAMFCNIPLGTQIALARPDMFRARLGSSMGFLVQVASPMGLALAGTMISLAGINWTLIISGAFTILLSPLLFLIPNYSTFLRLPANKATEFYKKTYPKAFIDSNN